MRKHLVHFLFIVTMLGDIVVTQSFAQKRPTQQPSSKMSATSQKQSKTELELQQRVTPKLSKMDIRGALNEIKSMLASDTSNVTLLTVQATLQTQLYNFNEAAQSYGKIIMLQPNNVYALQSRAQIYYERLNNPENSLRDWSRVVLLDSLNPAAWYSRGAIYQTQQKYEAAYQDFTKCLQVGIPDNIYALTQRGISLMKLRRISEATSDFTAVIKRSESSAVGEALFEALFYRGSIYLQNRKFAEAVNDFDRALRLNDQSGETYYLRAYAKMLSGRTEEGCIDAAQSKELTYPSADSLISRYCDFVPNLDSLRRFTMPTVYVSSKRSAQEIAVVASRRLLSRIQGAVENTALAQGRMPLGGLGTQTLPGLMSAYDCNLQRLEMMRSSMININCLAQVLQQELGTIADVTVQNHLNRIMSLATDLSLVDVNRQLSTSPDTNDDAPIKSIDESQIAQLRLQIGLEFRQLNSRLESLLPAKK